MGISRTTRIVSCPQKFSIKYNDKQFYEDNVLFADASILRIFTFPLLVGEPATALAEPFSLLITEEAARKYFGKELSIGKTLLFEDKYLVKITGVLQNVPYNSHFHFDFLFPCEMLHRLEESGEILSQVRYYTYVLISPHYDHSRVEAELSGVASRHGIGPKSGTYRLHLQPVSDLHLHSSLRNELEPNSIDIRYLQIFLLVALIIMLTAAINYTNMAMACSASRAKEIGVRKVVGASHQQLIGQFLVEPVLISSIALLFAFGLVAAFLPALSNLLGKKLAITFWNNWQLPLIFFGAALLIGSVSGCYPAFILSSFKTVNVLKGQTLPGMTDTRLRTSLVVFQFVASIAMIICTIIIFNQLNYIRDKNLGLNKDHVVVVPVENTRVAEKVREFKAELLRETYIFSVAASSSTPGRGKLQEIISGSQNPGSPITTLPIRLLFVDYDYTKTYNIKIVEGRGFSPDFVSDEIESIILNQTAVKELGLKSPIGSQTNIMMNRRSIIGVVEDFHLASLHERIEPVALIIQPFFYKYVSVKIDAQNISAAIRFIEQTWLKFTSKPFEYTFVDSDLDSLYRTEQRLSRIFGLLTLVTIMTSCLGLFGLAAFISEQRTKEIGVRKVLGASVSQIIFLITKDFSKLVALAFIIAAPIAYFVMNKWLQNFAYRTEIGFWIFILVGLLSLMIALFTVSYHSTKAALTNPVNALRCE